jgi:NADH-quinone oxidoreductase subunit M
VLLTATILAPLAGALACLAVPRRAANAARLIALIASLAAFGLSVVVALRFDPGQAGFQLGQSADWVRSLGIRWSVGVDGISLPLVLLTTVLTPLAILGAWRRPPPAEDLSAVEGEGLPERTPEGPAERPRGYVALLLVLEAALLGVFTSLDLFLFYVFWEAVLIPAYFLIGVWGGRRRVLAAVKFFIYTLLGGLLMLVSILGLYYIQRRAGGAPSFDYETLRVLHKDPTVQRWLFLGLFAAFAVKTPLVPFHSWLPDAYSAAPSTTTVILAGVMAKMGAYGFIRMALPLTPDGARWARPVVIALAVVGILYAAVVAIAQRDFKRLVAYSSISHMGFIVLGAFAVTVDGVQGSVFYMVAHGLIIGGLFFMVGMLEERLPGRTIDDLGGLQRVVPRMAGVMLVLTLASAALPGLVGFVGEFLVLLGAFQASVLAASVAVLGVILGAVYLLWAYQRMWQGELRSERFRGLPDLSGREWAVLLPLLAAIVVLGLAPQPLLDRVQPAARQVVEQNLGTPGPTVQANP